MFSGLRSLVWVSRQLDELARLTPVDDPLVVQELHGQNHLGEVELRFFLLMHSE